MTNLYHWPARRAEDRATQEAIEAGLQMVQVKPPAAYIPMQADGDPLAQSMAEQCQPRPAEACSELGAEPGHAQTPRQPVRLNAAGWAWASYVIGLAALAAWAYTGLR